MLRFCSRVAATIAALFQLSVPVSAGPLDEYYLQQFGEVKNIQLEKALLTAVPAAAESARCGMPLKHSLQRDWRLLEPSTQKVLAKQLALPTLSGTELTVVSSGGHYKVHYTDSGIDAPDIANINIYSGLALTDATDWAHTVAATFENIYTQYGLLGYQPAPTTYGIYDIYLHNLATQGYYGVTYSGNFAPSALYPNGVTSWLELDSSFTNSIYHPTTYTPLQSLQITGAHEYHHAVQYGYTYYFDIWYAEATSTWMEDELYAGVNQLYNYIPAWFNNSSKSLDITVGSDAVTIGAGYGRWIFNRYLAEKHGTDMIRSAWEKVGGLTSAGGADIPMAPVLDSLLMSATYNSSLGSDFFGFAKQVYTRAWTTQPADITYIHPYTPLASYSPTTSTPVNAGSSPAPTVTLPHYSFAYYRFIPTAGAPGDLSITLNGTSGIRAAAFIKSSGGVITEYPFAATTGTTVTVPGFSSSTEAVLLIVNAADSDNHTANFSTNGTGLTVTEPSGGTVYQPLQPAAPVNTGGGSGGGGGGCFIATAAYGSYLHPQVQLLRDFRDEYLLTNAPGRAFVSFYYRHSPPLADMIAQHSILRGMTRLALAPVVVAVAHPLISAVSLLLFPGVLLVSLRNRRKAARCTGLQNRTT